MGIDYKFCVVGGRYIIEQGKMYYSKLVDSVGVKHGIWAYGISSIMEAPEAVDLSPVKDVFPHVPEDIFVTIQKKEIDLLVGLNYVSLHPDGGQGRNSICNLCIFHSNSPLIGC